MPMFHFKNFRCLFFFSKEVQGFRNTGKRNRGRLGKEKEGGREGGGKTEGKKKEKSCELKMTPLILALERPRHEVPGLWDECG